jgi:hypothetical protein
LAMPVERSLGLKRRRCTGYDEKILAATAS